MPTGVQTNDVLIAQVAAYSTSVSIRANPPTGWTQIISKSSSNGYEKEWIFYHVTTSSEPASYTWNFNRLGSVVAGVAGGIAAYYNVNTVSPVDASIGQFTANSKTIKAPSLTTAAVNDRLLCFMTTFAGIPSTNWSALPLGMETKYIVESSGAHIDAGFFDQALSTAGTVLSKTATVTAVDNVGILVALRPGH